MPPPLEKYTNSSDENDDVKAFIVPQNIPNVHLEASYVSCQAMNNQIKELEVGILLMNNQIRVTDLFYWHIKAILLVFATVALLLSVLSYISCQIILVNHNIVPS